MKKSLVLFTLLLLAVAARAMQQDPVKKDQEASTKAPEVAKPPAPSTYKVAISIFELQDGKRINQRDYSLLLQGDDRGSNKLKIGTRAPISVDNDKITYADVGFDVDCSLSETPNNKVAIRLDLNLTSFAIPEQNTDPRTAGLRPVLRGVTEHVRAILTPGRPQVVASVDDVNSNKRMQVEVTATKVD